MMSNINVKHILEGLFDILYPRITKLHDFAGTSHQDVVMLSKAVRLLILCQILTKLMLRHQITFDQQIQRVVNSSATYPIVFVFHTDVQCLYIKVS